MKTLETTQAARAKSSGLAPLDLVIVTTYSDRLAGTVDDTYYLSTRVVDYPYGGSPQTFLPWLESVGDLAASMVHLPVSGGGALSRELELVLANTTWQGTRAAAVLEAGSPLEAARVEVAQLLLPEIAPGRLDLSAYAGTEHTVLFRGVVRRSLIDYRRITLSCETELKAYEWPNVLDADSTTPRDVGYRFPIAVGADVQVIAPALAVGPVLTLAEDINASVTGEIDFSGIGAGVPTAGQFSLRIGTEEILAEYASASSLNLITRAYASTSAALHYTGDAAQLLLLTGAAFVAHAYENASVSKVEVRSPQTGELIPLTGLYSVDASFTAYGIRNVTAVRMTQAQLRAALAIVGASTGTVADLELYVTLDGQPVPGQYVTAEGFEGGTWAYANCTTALGSSSPAPAQGTYYRSMVIDLDAIAGVSEQIQTENHLVNWSDDNGTRSSPTGAGHRAGSACIKVDADSAAQCVLRHADSALTIDLTDDGSNGRRLVMFDMRLDKAGSTGNIRFEYGHSAAQCYRNIFQADAFPDDEWVTVVLDYLNASTLAFNTPDPTDIDWFAVYFNNSNPSADAALYIDNWKTVATHSVIQNNALGGVDLDAADDLYRLAIYRTGNDIRPDGVEADDADGMTLDLELFLSSTTGSGTTLETNYRMLSFDSEQLPLDTWSDQQPETVSDTPTPPTLTSIATLHIHATNRLHGVYPRDPVYTYHIDDLRIADETLNPWPGATGTLIEDPADVARWWLSEVGGFDVHEASFSAAATALGSNILAGDFRGFGSDWLAALERLAVACRANFIPEETASGTQWKMLTASSSWGWGSAARTLTDFPPEGVVRGGRIDDAGGRELASGRTFLYDYRPQLGDGDAAYAKLVRIARDRNDSGGGVSAASIAAAVAAFGAVDAPPRALLGVADPATARELAGYYWTEGSRLAPVWILPGVSWSQAFDLELGDVVDFASPWTGSTIKLRVIETLKNRSTQTVDVRGVEVA